MLKSYSIKKRANVRRGGKLSVEQLVRSFMRRFKQHVCIHQRQSSISMGSKYFVWASIFKFLRCVRTVRIRQSVTSVVIWLVVLVDVKNVSVLSYTTIVCYMRWRPKHVRGSVFVKCGSPAAVCVLRADDDLKSASDAQEYAEQHGAVFVETSAKTAINIAALFLEISE